MDANVDAWLNLYAQHGEVAKTSWDVFFCSW